MIRSGKIIVNCAILLASLAMFSTTVYAAPVNDMRSIIMRYKEIGRVDEISRVSRTVIISGKKFELAAGVTILSGYDKHPIYNINSIAVGMQVGYKLESNHSATISELWILPE